ncbi:hypothetical protein DS831_06240 [Bombilactobacillus bombi]|uniref:DUF4491 family protein n=1 Tax=Bombilactobacillus bombi TaxID=1303590 RepID=A0A3R6ZX48_9LACO|nr:hypothetical protein [Bombilactobacillus bombi]RHW49759.1 hypothetical protein DS831_06240 [Bombilactobacillus bombi]
MDILIKVLVGMLFVAVIYLIEKALVRFSKWYGAVPLIIWSIFIGYLLFTKGLSQFLGLLVVWIVGISVLAEIWQDVWHKKKHIQQRELDSMKAKDFKNR